MWCSWVVTREGEEFAVFTRSRTTRRGMVLIGTAVLMVVAGAPPTFSATPAQRTVDDDGVLIGATVYPHSPRETIPEEIAFLEGAVGPLEIRRVYDSGFLLDFMVRAGADVGVRATHYSFKPDLAALAAGSLDADVLTLLNSIPVGHQTLLTIWHEPEDNFTTDEQKATYRAAWQRFADLVHGTGRPELTTSWVMMSYSWWTSSGRDPMDWYPGDEYIDSVGIDTYNEGSLRGDRWDSPGRGVGLPFAGDTAVPGGYVYEGAIRWAQARGLPWGIAEFGSLENVNHIDSTWAKVDEKWRWIHRAVKFYARNGASYIEYFHCGPYRGPWWLDSSSEAMASFKWALDRF
jgi:hypothetical protein